MERTIEVKDKSEYDVSRKVCGTCPFFRVNEFNGRHGFCLGRVPRVQLDGDIRNHMYIEFPRPSSCPLPVTVKAAEHSSSAGK